MKQFWKSMLKSPSGVVGLVILVLAISIAVFGPMLFPNSPWRMVQRPFLPPFTNPMVTLGTDALGRDVFAGMIFGARVSLLVGLVSTLVALVVGVPIGAMAGYFGGKVDDALMRFTEFFQTIPSFALAIVLVAILTIAIAVALIGPLLFPTSPWRMVQRPFLPPFTMANLPLGTDALGRDVMAGIIYGARVSLLVGLISTLASLAVGIPLGAAAGYFGGKIDDALMRFTEFFQTVPSFALAIVLVAIMQPSIVSIVVAIAIVSWPPVARLVRGEVLSLRTREYVQAAVVTGQTNWWIIWREILPNALSPVIVLASLMVATAILLESSLSFLGLGDPNLMSWGYMVGAGRTVIRQAWWITVFPGIAILVSVLALNLIGEGLNDALNPRLAKGGR